MAAGQDAERGAAAEGARAAEKIMMLGEDTARRIQEEIMHSASGEQDAWLLL